MRSIKLFVILSVTVAALSGCGQRGPLYLPSEQASENQPKEEAQEAKPEQDKSNTTQTEDLNLDVH